jgi:hypothetical protein
VRLTDPQTKREKHIGRYASEEDAARAYDCAAVQAHGPGTKRNFPGEVISELPVSKGDERKQRKSSKYIGVTRDKRRSSWNAQLTDTQTKTNRYIGNYASEEDAARAFDCAAVQARGISLESTTKNLWRPNPKSAWSVNWRAHRRFSHFSGRNYRPRNPRSCAPICPFSPRKRTFSRCGLANGTTGQMRNPPWSRRSRRRSQLGTRCRQQWSQRRTTDICCSTCACTDPSVIRKGLLDPISDFRYKPSSSNAQHHGTMQHEQQPAPPSLSWSASAVQAGGCSDADATCAQQVGLG